MKAFLLLPFFLLLPVLNIFSQQLPGGQFIVNDSFVCPYDTGSLILSKQNWEVYQTSNDLWDGPRDSTCLSLRDNTGGWYGRILLSEIDTSRIVFVRWISGSTFPLDTSMLYGMMSDVDVSSLRTDNNCPGGLCTGLQVGIEIPDSAGTGTDLRWYMGGYVYNPMTGPQVGLCFATEKFDSGNAVKEVILQLKTGQIQTGTTQIGFTRIGFDDFSPYWPQRHGNFVTNLQTGAHQWRYDINGMSGPWDNHLVVYNDTSYPNQYNISFADVVPSPNPASVDTIDLVVNQGATLNFQPYSQLRGGLMQGSTTQRHVVNLINNGGEICLAFLEIQMPDGASYIHNSGTLTTDGDFNCMMFWNGGNFVLGDNQTLHYGKNHKGMLVFKTGSTLVIGKNSEFIVGNEFIFGMKDNDTTKGHMYMTMNYGSKLTFAPGSHLWNMLTDGSGRLFVKMRGGVIDDSNLAEWERQLIVKEYDSPQSFLDDNLRILENPFAERLTLSWISEGNEKIELSLMDMQGKLVYSGEWTAGPGMDFFEIPLDGGETGVLFLSVKTEKGIVTRKVLRIGN